GGTPGTGGSPRAGIVTPPYPGWVSDGSAFGRAAATILTAETGRPRYRRIADQEGISGVDAGTQTAADDVAGRRLGSRVGQPAWARPPRYFPPSPRGPATERPTPPTHRDPGGGRWRVGGRPRGSPGCRCRWPPSGTPPCRARSRRWR